MNRSAVLLTGSASVVGARTVPSEEVDRAFGMPEGKLRKRAGIVSLAYAAEHEDEVSLGADAGTRCLASAGCDKREVDWILGASETYHAYPTLSALLHAKLDLRENCAALDVNNGCLSLVQALAVGQSLIASGQAGKVLIVTADVHSRTLSPGRAAGEFGGLFGDGAGAFLLTAASLGESRDSYLLGEFFFGCAAQYASAISVSDTRDGGLEVQFDGEALSRAAVTRMEKILDAVELRSGIARKDVGAFATHQPNPRLVALLARQLDVSVYTFPPIAQTSGNLGSSTCGAALDHALQQFRKLPAEARRPIFLASLGPGLVFGGGWISPKSL